MQAKDTPKKEPSLAALLTDFSGTLTTLMRQEGALIKAEISEKMSATRNSIGALAIGGAVLFAGFLVLLFALVAGLNQALLPVSATYPWLSPSIVGLLVSGAGIWLLWKGRSDLLTGSLFPGKTSQSLRRDTQVLKEQLR